MKKIVYADNAATTQLDPDAFEAMKPYLLQEYANPSQPYSIGRRTKKAMEEARAVIAACIGAETDEIYFTSGGTESDNWAIQCGSGSGGILTSEIEHHAVLHSCAACAQKGQIVDYVDPTPDGVITPEAVETQIKEHTKLISVMTANNEIGTIQPISEIADICRKHNVMLHTDAVQAVGHIPLDVRKLGVDLLSASAHKFHGPRGVGFLYIKKGTPIIPFMNGGSQEAGLRAGTQNVPAVVGMAAALQKSSSHVQETMANVRSLETALLEGLTRNGIRYTRNGGNKTLPGLISLSFSGYDGEAILHRSDLLGVILSTGSACDGQRTEISHVLKAIRLEDELARGTIRISLGDLNQEEDVMTIVRTLTKILK